MTVREIKSIGRVSVSKGNWVQKTSPNGYKASNEVELYGCTFRSKVDDNCTKPAEYNDQAGTITFINTDKWECVKDFRSAWLLDVQWPQKEQEMEDFKGGVDERIASKLDDVTYDSESGSLVKRRGETTTPIVSIVTSGFRVHFNNQSGLMSLTPLGGASISFNTDTGYIHFSM